MGTNKNIHRNIYIWRFCLDIFYWISWFVLSIEIWPETLQEYDLPQNLHFKTQFFGYLLRMLTGNNTCLER
jgi:hypothetical protein